MTDSLIHPLQQGKAVDYIRRIMAAFDAYEFSDWQDETSPQSEKQSWMCNQALDKPLTNREFKILSFFGQRLQNKEIAANLFISPETVKKHVRSIYRKLDSRNRQQAMTKAYRLGVLTNRRSDN